MKNTAAFLLSIFCLTSVAFVARAEETPTITISKGDRINLTLTPLSGGEGATATKTLQHDLELAGYFTMSANASYTAKGSASGGSLQGQVLDHSGGTVLSKTYSGGARETAHHFADDIVETLTGNKGIAGSKIAFIGTRSGKKEVYVGDYDGSNVKQLTHDGVISVHPSISPDGRRIAFVHTPNPLLSYGSLSDISVLSVAMGTVSPLVRNPGSDSDPQWSPDGTHVLFSTANGDTTIYVLNLP